MGAEAIGVEGTLTTHGCAVTALIDPDSTHSFVNETYACHLDWVGKELPNMMHVGTHWESQQ
jgi:hypothetical protein